MRLRIPNKVQPFQIEILLLTIGKLPVVMIPQVPQLQNPPIPTQTLEILLAMILQAVPRPRLKQRGPTALLPFLTTKYFTQFICSDLQIYILTFQGDADDELDFMAGDLVEVLEKSDSGWWKGRCHGKEVRKSLQGT